MRISLIAALTPAGVIGKNNQLPWRMPADLQYFKKMTLNKPVIMGRKTYESIGKPLPSRKNIIITQNPHFSIPPEYQNTCQIAHAITEALALDDIKNCEEVFVIGGSEIFTRALPLANYLYLTFIEADIAGDIYFPEWDKTLWTEVSREHHFKDAENPYDYSFVIFKKDGNPITKV